MSQYTRRVSEYLCPLATEYADSIAAAVNATAWVSLQNYHRAWLYLNVGDIAANSTVDVYLQQATTVGGAGGKAITGKAITQLTAGDDDVLVCIELQTEELDVSNDFSFVRVIYHVNGTSAELAFTLFGVEPRFEAVSVAAWQEVVG